MVSAQEVAQDVNQALMEHQDAPIDVLREMYKEAEGIERGIINEVLENLDSEMDFFCYKAASKDINDNKREKLEEEGLIEARNEVIAKIEDELDMEDLSAAVALPVAKGAGLEDLAEELKGIEDEMEEVKEPFKKLAKPVNKKKNDAKEQMKGKVQAIFRREPSTPSGVQTQPE
jgi:hypothetical protein